MELTPNNEQKVKLLQSELFTSKFSSLVPEGIKQTFEQHHEFLLQREELVMKSAKLNPDKQIKPQIITHPSDFPITKAIHEQKPDLLPLEHTPSMKSRFEIKR